MQKQSFPIIKIKSIFKRYSHGEHLVQALEDISFDIEQGDVFGVIGLSGAGKSTLIRCLCRLVVPTSGAVLFHGQDIGQMDKKMLRGFRKKIGMIFQNFNLLTSRTVADNIAYPLEITHLDPVQRVKRVDDLLALVGLTNKKDVYPAYLSGGEKQRVGIARALVNHPEVLLCDEATSALDPRTTREILALLKNINKNLGVTIVLITHEMEVIKQICNKVAVIEGGKIVEQGPVAQVFSDPQHHTTRHFLENASHEIPDELIQRASPNRKLLRLRFRGQSSGQPLISEIVKKFNVSANILVGWIDRLQTVTVGVMVIELIGSPEDILQALDYLSHHHVHYEVIEHGS